MSVYIIYIILGMGAMLAGYTRMTYSLAVIVMETSQAINIFIPIIVKIIEPLSNESTVTVATSINGVSVLFGTLISITYSILFNRQSQLQDAATKESATLSYLTRAISDFFDMNSHIFSVNDKMDHLQCIWQHCVTLVGKSRGYELVQILEDDPDEMPRHTNRIPRCRQTLEFRPWVQKPAIRTRCTTYNCGGSH